MADEIEAFAKAWDGSFSAGDFSKLKAFYALNARVIPAGGTPVAGNDAIGAFFGDIHAKGLTKHEIAVDSVIPNGDTAIASGRWSLSGSSDANQGEKFGGNWVNVLGRDGDSWKILLHTWN